MRTDARIVVAFGRAADGSDRSNALSDASNIAVFEGTSRIQRLVIARHATGLR